MFAATLAMGMLISPYVFFYDSMLLLVPLAILWARYSEVSGGRLLDGGPLMAWPALLYVAPFSGNLLAAGQLRLSAALGLPQAAVQLAVPVIAGWAWVVARSAQSPTRLNASLTRPTIPV